MFVCARCVCCAGGFGRLKVGKGRFEDVGTRDSAQIIVCRTAVRMRCCCHPRNLEADNISTSDEYSYDCFFVRTNGNFTIYPTNVRHGAVSCLIRVRYAYITRNAPCSPLLRRVWDVPPLTCPCRTVRDRATALDGFRRPTHRNLSLLRQVSEFRHHNVQSAFYAFCKLPEDI